MYAFIMLLVASAIQFTAAFLALPQLTGTELAQEIIKVRPQLPIVICTGFSESITPEQIKALGIGELLMKPLTPDRLADAVHRGLDTRKNLTELSQTSITH